MRTLLATCLVALFCSSTRADDSCPGISPAPDLTGRWTGCWVSDKNGHHGPLRAHVTRLSDTCYRVRFAGRFWKVFPFVYAVTLRVVDVRPDGVVLSGGLYLGPLLGVFHTEAVVTPTHFDARFSSKNDSGRFVLTRSCR